MASFSASVSHCRPPESGAGVARGRAQNGLHLRTVPQEIGSRLVLARLRALDKKRTSSHLNPQFLEGRHLRIRLSLRRVGTLGEDYLEARALRQRPSGRHVSPRRTEALALGPPLGPPLRLLDVRESSARESQKGHASGAEQGHLSSEIAGPDQPSQATWVDGNADSEGQIPDT